MTDLKQKYHMDSGVIYNVQEYKEALAKGEKPRGTPMTEIGIIYDKDGGDDRYC